MREILLKGKFKDSVDGFVLKAKSTEDNLLTAKQMAKVFSSSLMDHIIQVSGWMTNNMVKVKSNLLEAQNT